MVVARLSLTNFRNYGRLELDLPTGPILLYGRNAQGKTNLLEAVYYLATARSPYAERDQQLLNWEANDSEELLVVGRLMAQIVTDAGTQQLELRLIKEQKQPFSPPTFRREALLNRRQVRLMDFIGHLRAVLFLPEDLQLIVGSPANRRRYLDITLCQTDSFYCRTLSEYNKLLDQRNALLRQIAETGTGRDLLPLFNDRLSQTGSELFSRRASLLAYLAREAQRIHYEALTNRQETVRLFYQPQLEQLTNGNDSLKGRANAGTSTLAQWLLTQTTDQIANHFRELLQLTETQDITRAATTTGPHRDDWFFQVNGRELQYYGSRGQQRTALLALKLAEINWMEQQTGELPILLLDEVVAELDAHRRELLLEWTQRAPQAILTATDPGMFSSSFLQKALTLQIINGRVQRNTVT